MTSTSIFSHSTSGTSFETMAENSPQRSRPWICAFDFVATHRLPGFPFFLPRSRAVSPLYAVSGEDWYLGSYLSWCAHVCASIWPEYSPSLFSRTMTLSRRERLAKTAARGEMQPRRRRVERRYIIVQVANDG